MEAETVNGQCPLCGAYTNDTDTGDGRNLKPGTILHGQYLIGKTIGKGGFGITYIAYDLRHGRKVAIKEYMPRECCIRSENGLSVEVVAEPELFEFGLSHFKTEAEILYTLREHEGIVHVEKLFPENNTRYFAMEYLDGMDLAKYITNQPNEKIPWQDAVEMILPVLDTLDIIHRNNLIHRDISPDNLFICENNVIKLIDFGAASADFGDKSMTSKVILKRGYAPIEQYSLGNHTPRIDIYSLGSTLYSMITGVTPPESTSRNPKDNMKEAIQFCPSIPKKLNDVLKKAMEVMPQNRFSEALEFKRALESVIPHPKSASQIPPSDPDDNQNKTIQRLEHQGSRIYTINKKKTNLNTKKIDPPRRKCSIEAIERMSFSEYFGARIYNAILPIAIALISITNNVGLLIALLMFVVPLITEITFSLQKWSKQGEDGEFRLCTTTGDAPSVMRALIRVLLKYVPYWFGAYISTIVIQNVVIAYMVAITAINIITVAISRRTLYDIISGCCIAPYTSVSSKPSINRNFYELKLNTSNSRTNYSEGYAKFRLTCTVGNLKGMVFDIDSSNSSYVLGRNPSLCSIIVPVDTPGISGKHCQLRVCIRDEYPYIELVDLGSTFGTYLNGEKIPSGSVIAIGDDDKLRLGNSLFIVNILNYTR